MEDIKYDTVQISGLSALDKALQKFPEKLQKRILVGGVRAGANVVRDEARKRAQTAEKDIIKKFSGQKILIKPGFMRKKIASWQRRRTEYAVTFSVGVYGYKDRFTKFFAFWWRFFEFGTSKMAASPFIRPSFESRKMQAIEKMRQYMNERMDKEVLKG